jgi:toxin-antitoxin system PIN domain toxin
MPIQPASSLRALLDVNVLIALLNEQNVFHEKAQRWWIQHRNSGWATCPLTQNGFIRIASQMQPQDATYITKAMDVLSDLTRDKQHVFFDDDVSVLDTQRFARQVILGHRQLTDIYLLGLAVKHQACFATFDQNIPLSAVQGATNKHLLLI